MLAAELVLTLSARQDSRRDQYCREDSQKLEERGEMIFRAVSCLLLSLAHSESLETGSVRLRTDHNCPLLDGVFVSIMRRIFNPGYHKVLHYIT